jgi:hypothetical protein
MLPKLQICFDRLESSREHFLEELSQRHPVQLGFSPGPDSWSLLQIAEHMVLVEEGLLVRRAITKPLERHYRRKLKHRFLHFIVVVVFRMDLRVPMPVKDIAPEGNSSLTELKDKWTQLRIDLRTKLDSLTENTALLPFVQHPVLGPIHAFATLRFLQRHFDHHLRLGQRLVRHDSYPAEPSGGVHQAP